MLDKLDYCASLRNLDNISHLPNLKVSFLLLLLESRNHDNVHNSYAIAVRERRYHVY